MIENNILLSKFIKNNLVDYDLLLEDDWLDKQIKMIECANLEKYSKKEKLVFWINTYNIIVLKSVIIEFSKNSNWRGNISIIGKFKFFIFRKHKVSNHYLSLYQIENTILRKEFNDPRIHFAINCASLSCPYLPDRLFDVDTIDDYLEYLTHEFINNKNNVIVMNNILYLNRIFKWYKNDFDSKGGLITFINKYTNDKLIFEKIKYFKYDWKVNSS